MILEIESPDLSSRLLAAGHDDLANFAYQPDVVVNDVGDIELDMEFSREMLEDMIA